MKAWDTMLEGRDTLSWQRGRHGCSLVESYQQVHLADVGILPEPRLLPVHQRIHDRNGTMMATGSALASFLLGLPAVKQRQAGIPQMQLRQWYADGFVQDSFRMTPTTTIEMGLRYEYMQPLVDISYTNSNLTFDNGVPSAFIGGQKGFPQGAEVSESSITSLRGSESQRALPSRAGFSRRVRHLLHAGGYEYVVQPAA